MSDTPKSIEGIEAFVKELSSFAVIAESKLSLIQADMDNNKAEFSIFSEKMLAIRGTADQLGLPHISSLAGMAEEIALKAVHAQTRPQIRKCLGTLWDAMTTIKYLLEHDPFAGPQEEEQILIHRLEATLQAFGGARPSVNASEIEELLRKQSGR